MKIKKTISILHEWENKQSGFSFGQSEFDEAVNEGKKALLCWLWMCKAVEAGLSDKDIMKVIRKGFMEALETDE